MEQMTMAGRRGHEAMSIDCSSNRARGEAPAAMSTSKATSPREA
jgi:hypothetical protein